MNSMHYATLELSPDRYDQYKYRGCPYLLQLATRLGVSASAAQLEQDLLFLVLTDVDRYRIPWVFYAKLIVIYYFHRQHGLPLLPLFRRFHIPTSVTNMQAYHRFCELKHPDETPITRRHSELNMYRDKIQSQFHLSDACMEQVVRLCRIPQMQQHMVRHLIAAAVLYMKPSFQLTYISILDVAAWAHCSPSTLVHLRRSFQTLGLPSISPMVMT